MEPVTGVIAASALMTALLQARAQKKQQERQIRADAEQRGLESKSQAVESLTNRERAILNDILSQQRGSLLS